MLAADIAQLGNIITKPAAHRNVAQEEVENAVKSDPAEPFPVKTFLAPLDNCGKPVAVEESEVKEVLTKGYMNLVGGLLWAGRNTLPAMAFALSQLVC